MSITHKEYNRLNVKKYREEQKRYQKLYQDFNVSGITFTDFVKQEKQTAWKKLSIALSDEELKLGKLSYKLSDQNLRSKLKKKEAK